MTSTDPWDGPLKPEILEPPVEPLDAKQLDILWQMFRGIATHWKLDIEVELLRSRWLDMLEARGAGEIDYRGEYANAAEVFEALVRRHAGADSLNIR